MNLMIHLPRFLEICNYFCFAGIVVETNCTPPIVEAQVDTSHIMHTGTGRHKGEVPRQTDGVTKLPMAGVVQRGKRRQQRHLV